MSLAVCAAVAWLAWLAWPAWPAGAAEYVDYSGAHMPLFEGGEYDPPAPPAARYPHPHPQPHRETTEPSYILKEDAEPVRPQPIKKPSHKLQPIDEEDDIIDIFDKYKYKEPHSFKSSDSYAKWRSARIGYSPRDESTAAPRATAWRGRPRARGGGDEYDEHEHSDETEREGNSRVRMLDDEGYRPPLRRNGKMRRKPRARGARNRPEDVPDDDDDEVGRWSKGDDAVNFDRREETGDAYDGVQRREGGEGGEAQYEEAAEDESTAPPPPPPPPPARTRPPYYQEYYDMQRVKSIKNKLAALKRRTQARLREAATPTRAHRGGAWAGPRRPPAALAHRHPDTPGNSTGAPTTTPTTPTTPTTLTPTAERTDAEELSIAEKSRLSILKKAQRKESVDVEAATAKPPVLLQVTQRLQTVVMVEGGRRAGGGGGPRLVAQDSPERLAKVRRLMRHKLVAGARSVQDLTDNWDDLVCDYFDVRALDSAAPAHPAHRAHRAHTLVLLLCFSATSLKFI